MIQKWMINIANVQLKLFIVNISATGHTLYYLPFNILLQVGFSTALRAFSYFCDTQTYSPRMDLQLVWVVQRVL